MSFEWLEKKLQQQIEGQYYGNIVSFFHGAGIEVADFRRYQAGDTPRSINRKLSAKHDELRINKRYDEKDIQVDILLDINPNRSTGRTQTNRSIVQDRLSDYILFTKKQGIKNTKIFFPQGSVLTSMSCSHIGSWVQGCTSRQDEVAHHSGGSRYISHMQAFLSGQVQKKKKRVIILFSDFLFLEEEQKEELLRLDTQHVVAQILIDVPQVVGRNFDRYSLV